MNISKPIYYDSFRCIAGACPDSCCKEWDVQVDELAAEYYRSLPGDLGDRLRQVLREEDGQTVMTIVDGRCPMWREDGLCRIQAELGENALCQVCREFPRLRHDYGDFLELGLELSCPEAARLILAASGERMTCSSPEIGEAEYDTEAMDALKASRECALSLLTGDPAQALAKLLIYGYQAQGELDGEAPAAFDGTAALDAARSLRKEPDESGFFAFFAGLEILTATWEAKLKSARFAPLFPETLALTRYLVERYWLQAVSDYDLAARVKLIVISAILVSALPGPYLEAAQQFSKEIENDADNIDAILDAAYDCPAFTDDKLLGILLK